MLPKVAISSPMGQWKEQKGWERERERVKSNGNTKWGVHMYAGARNVVLRGKGHASPEKHENH